MLVPAHFNACVAEGQAPWGDGLAGELAARASLTTSGNEVPIAPSPIPPFGSATSRASDVVSRCPPPGYYNPESGRDLASKRQRFNALPDPSFRSKTPRADEARNSTPGPGAYGDSHATSGLGRASLVREWATTRTRPTRELVVESDTPLLVSAPSTRSSAPSAPSSTSRRGQGAGAKKSLRGFASPVRSPVQEGDVAPAFFFIGNGPPRLKRAKEEGTAVASPPPTSVFASRTPQLGQARRDCDPGPGDYDGFKVGSLDPGPPRFKRDGVYGVDRGFGGMEARRTRTSCGTSPELGPGAYEVSTPSRPASRAECTAVFSSTTERAQVMSRQATPAPGDYQLPDGLASAASRFESTSEAGGGASLSFGAHGDRFPAKSPSTGPSQPKHRHGPAGAAQRKLREVLDAALNRGAHDRAEGTGPGPGEYDAPQKREQLRRAPQAGEGFLITRPRFAEDFNFSGGGRCHVVPGPGSYDAHFARDLVSVAPRAHDFSGPPPRFAYRDSQPMGHIPEYGGGSDWTPVGDFEVRGVAS
mmetsp:Transcript_62790/g.182102  ORF Transcript_62790/g.182102 Transcript_62790/m.182102 type:complete len:531 (+) Transcript_62790:26-1618(+)